MRPIPKKVKEQLANDPYMQQCCACKSVGVKIEWHHALIYAGRQSDDPMSIMPVCVSCHKLANNSHIKERIDLAMFNRGLDVDLYPNANLTQRRKYLKEKYETI